MTNIYLVRHAEAEGNLYRRVHGQFESRLTANGLRQVAALERRFAELPVDACYASDLLRTQLTARAVYLPKALPLRLDPGFREIHFGVWEDQPFGWLFRHDPAGMDAFYHDPLHWHVEGGETFEEYTARFLEAMTRAAEANAGKTIAIFTHGAILRGVCLKLFPAAQADQFKNTSVSLLHYDGGAYSFSYLNDSSHLDAPCRKPAGKNQNLWFRPGIPSLPGLELPEHSGTVFTAMLEDSPVGCLCLSACSEDTGQMDYMVLCPEKRGQNLAVQLLGQAVFYFRAQGKRRMVFRLPQNDEAMAALCRRLSLPVDETGVCELDLRLTM